MKIRLILIVFGILSIFACNQKPGKIGAGSGSATLKSDIDSASYALALDIALNIKKSGLDEINMAAFEAAFDKVFNNDTANLAIKADDAGMVVQTFFAKKYKEMAEKNKKDGENFLAENKKKAGIITTPSGIQYQVLKEGNGAIPSDTSKVKVHYHGTLIDGTVFDSSVDRGQPVEFFVKGVVQGWQQVLQIMPVGSKWKVFLPSELAYGDRPPRGSVIGPDMVLIFEMELLDIVAPQQTSVQGNPVIKSK
jgi:FKBP-type peptidyl-prolyl cis-trans isomerase FklB